MTTPDVTRARRRRAARWGYGAAFAPVMGLMLASGPAQAQLLPQLGAPVELGDLRGAFARAYGPAGIGAPGGAERNWTITPGIDVEVTATDNVRGLTATNGGGGGGGGGGGRGKAADLLTTITPSLSIQGASRRLTGSLVYSPQLRMFLRNSNMNSVPQNLNASARATIFEDLLYINASAYAAEYSRAGGLGGGATGRLSRQDMVQTSGFTVSPQLRQAFGDYGSAELSHAYSVLKQTGQGLQASTPFAPAVAAGITTINTTQASFTSGQVFERLNFTVSAVRSKIDGVGVLKNAHRNTESLDLGYAVTRSVTVLGELGHQDVQYGGTRKIRIDAAYWSAGARWTPDPDTSVTVRYGYRDGGPSYRFEGSMAPTARTRVSLAYSDGMANAAEELQSSIGRTQLSRSGITIDPVTGMPVILTNNFSGAQGGLSRVKRYTASAVLIGDLDVFTVTLNRDERTTLSGDAPGAVAPAFSFTNASLAWQRELGPGVRGNAQASYSERTAGGFGSQQTMTFSTGVNWALSETLSTRVSYTFTRANSSQRGFGYQANLVSLGVRKTF